MLTQAAVAPGGDDVAGVATAAAHAEALWSMGVEVAETHRGRGLGAALTSALGAAILELGHVPVHSTGSVNVPSMRAALAAGFRQWWFDVYSTRRHAAADDVVTPHR